VGACDADPSLLSSRLANGQSIEDAVRSDTATIVLVYDSEMCFSCSPMFTRWEAIARQAGMTLILLLADEPSPDDARALRRERIPVAGVVADWPKRLVPAEYVFRRGVLVTKAEGMEEIRRSKLWERTWAGS
jgi:hypothetical protein